MSVLRTCFDKSVNQASPVQKSYVRVVNYDGDGNEVIVYRETDYPSIQKRNGLVGDWTLDSLLKAGISPEFNIRTGSMSRLELESIAAGILSDVESNLKTD